MDNGIVLYVDELWDRFQSVARFEDEFYDLSLAAKIRAELGLPPTGSMKKLLLKHAVSVERLLSAILTSLRPFSQMMSDLLQLFERIAAKESDNNLKVQFDFNARDVPYSFDLTSFRKSVWQVKKELAPIYMLNNPWEMLDIFRNLPIDESTYEYCCYSVFYVEFVPWMTIYEKDEWPDYMPSQPMTGIESLDNKVRILWFIVEQSLNIYKQAYNPKLGRKRSHLEECYRRQDAFWFAETDFWIGTFFKKAIRALESMNARPDNMKIVEARALEEKIDSFLDSPAVTRTDVVTIVQELTNILSLPFWKKRYELYSAWVFTQIASALNELGTVFHVNNGLLSFSFGGSHLATCTKLTPPLHIYAELRTPFSNPVSPRRKKHIQPDYTLAIEPVSDPYRSVAVVECKQYKRPSRKNFLDAVIDYARGRPKASVLLVNYGHLPANMHEKLESKVREHTSLFGFVQPNTQAARDFQDKLKKDVLNYYKKRSKYTSSVVLPWNDPDAPCTIQLKWKKAPRDLDLYLYIHESDNKEGIVFYQNRYYPLNTDSVCLDQDCQQGNGCETIQIKKWWDATYDVVIKNYSGESDIDGYVEVVVRCGTTILKGRHSGTWRDGYSWHVFRISPIGAREVDHWIRTVSD